MSRNEHFEQGHSPHVKFVDEIDPSLSVDHSPAAEESRQEWIHNVRWPSTYLDEATNDANYQQSLQGNLRRMGYQDRVTLRRRGEPRGPITNASLFPDWEGKASSGDLHEWQVPIEHVVGYGHPDEGEVFVRHR
jgi:hypothetical protein